LTLRPNGRLSAFLERRAKARLCHRKLGDDCAQLGYGSGDTPITGA
jgi:hypothetical protein